MNNHGGWPPDGNEGPTRNESTAEGAGRLPGVDEGNDGLICGVDYQQLVRGGGVAARDGKNATREDMRRAGITPKYADLALFPIRRDLPAIMRNHELPGSPGRDPLGTRADSWGQGHVWGGLQAAGGAHPPRPSMLRLIKTWRSLLTGVLDSVFFNETLSPLKPSDLSMSLAEV
jgi:hypothetical protein